MTDVNKTEWEKVQYQCYEEVAKSMPVMRKMLGLTQKDLAERVGVSRQTIATIENTLSFKKWRTFLAVMFVFYFPEKTREYLANLDIPYAELKARFYGDGVK